MPVLNTREAMRRFGIKSPTTMLQVFRTKGSPAYLVGRSWMVEEEDLKKFLIKRSERLKG